MLCSPLAEENKVSIYPLLCVLRTALFWSHILRTVYQQKKNHFGRFHLHKEDKMTVYRISGVSWHTSVRTCVRWTTEIRKIEKPEKFKMQ